MDQLDSSGGITSDLVFHDNRKGDLGDFAIQECHDQKLFILHLFSFLLNFHFGFCYCSIFDQVGVFFQLVCE